MTPLRKAAYALLAAVVAALALFFSDILAPADPPPLVPVSVPVSAPAVEPDPVVAPVDVVAPDAPVAVPVEVL